MIKSLREIPPLLSSLASDLLIPGILVKYLSEGLPAAVSRNAHVGIRNFYELWQRVIQGVFYLV